MNRSFWGYAWPWAGLAPFFSRTRFFEAGEVRLAILSLVSEGPKHGYQLMKELQDRSGGMYRASAGSVYPTLKQLEDEGLIAETKENGRRIFSLTAAGRKELESDPEGVRRIWERAEQCEDWGQFMGPETATLLPSMAGFMKACFRAAGRGRGERVRSILDRTRREVEDL